MVAAVVHTRGRRRPAALPRRSLAGALGLAAAIIAACGATFDGGQMTYLPQNTAVALAAALLVAVVSFPVADGARVPRLQRVLELRPLIAIGIVSYSMFLWHQPVIHWLAGHGLMLQGVRGLAANTAITAVVVGALSALTYRFVERPALRRKGRPGDDRTPLSAAQTMAP